MSTQPSAKERTRASPKPNDGQVQAEPGEPMKKNGNNGAAQHSQGCAE